MMQPIERLKVFVQNKKVDVLGIGISNTPLIKKLVELDAFVTARDKKTWEQLGDIASELKALGVTLILGEDYLQKLEGDIVFKSPGIRFDKEGILKAKNKGAVITSEMELFFELCQSKIIAVTGSDGKTTTTTLIHKLLEKQGIKCHLGGNIGKPLLPQIEEIGKEDMVVLELSSFQLHTLKKSPNVAVITNITPNHLDWHTSYEEYIEAKKNIFLFQSKSDKLVINVDNEITASFAKEAKGEVFGFSYNKELQNGVCLDGENIVAVKNGVKEIILNKKELLLLGKHNVENYMAAICATLGVVSYENIKEVARTFGGVEHRLELVREFEGVKYINSSIDSSPNRTIAALSTFSQKIILIAGGKKKGIPFDDLGEHIAKKVKVLITIGETAQEIENSLQNVDLSGEEQPKIIRCKTYEEIICVARENAKVGDIVLLSPASTSFDMFKNFEERGNLFKELVHKMRS